MKICLTMEQKQELAAAMRVENGEKRHRPLQAIFLLAKGYSPSVISVMLHCSRVVVYKWARKWRIAGLEGLKTSENQGRPRYLDSDAGQLIVALITGDPRKQGFDTPEWTAAMFQSIFAQAGNDVSKRTIYRAMHRLNLRSVRGWKRTSDSDLLL